LFDILVILVAAKLAAEVADRIGVPAVVGEIVAGALIGPSVLGVVEPNEVLATLAELGVILLLLDVGMEMDLADLRSVGRAALGVAVVGVVVPFALGMGASLGLGLPMSEAVFLGAALTATSVGITARVFGDLRALATVEARTVLGAAVADDVMGLLILTVVARVVTEGSVSALSVLELSALAVGFLVVVTWAGLRGAPILFRYVARSSRSNGTLVAIALAFTLALAELAHAVELAPIIGAFVAGLALSRTHQAERIRRELMPIGHLFIPVFFLQIGIDVELGEFAKPEALGMAAVLLAVGVIGKLASSAGLFGAAGDKLLIGIGMVPRGEVGLIFATLGLREGVFGDDVYAALLIVVLVTTIGTPPALRWRLKQLEASEDAPEGTDLSRAVLAARRVGDGSGGPDDLEVLDGLAPGVRRLDPDAQAAWVEVFMGASPGAWRALAVHGVLERSLPELAEAVEHRLHATVVDPLTAFRWERHDQIRSGGLITVPVLIAAIVVEAVDDPGAAPSVARATAERLGLDADDVARTADLVADAELLAGMARRPDGLDEDPVLTLAAHLGDARRLAELAALTRSDDLDPMIRDRVERVVALADEALASGAGVVLASDSDLDRRRDAVFAELGDVTDEMRRLIATAPRSYLLRHDATTIARHVRRRAVSIRRDEVHVHVDPLDPDARGPNAGRYRVEFVARDRIGLLARQTRTLSEFRADVVGAEVVTWPAGRALSSFEVVSPTAPDGPALARRVRELFPLPLVAPARADVRLEWDDHGSPWNTRCIVRGPDRLGVLAAVTTAFGVSRVSVHSAAIGTDGDEIHDVFELTDVRQRKLDEKAKLRVELALREGSIRAARGPRVRVRA
jgi:Kef-type K+ transport system membrane component KefB